MEIVVPRDVIAHVKKHFANCNKLVASELSAFPAIHEESLDMNFISYFSRHQAPFRLPSDWIVSIEVHFMGGGRHYGTWEVADIGVVMVFRRRGKVIRSKLSFLQSKKLYASNVKLVEDFDVGRGMGLGRVFVPDREYEDSIEPRVLAFKDSSRYLAYKKGSEQQNTMRHFEGRWDTEMYYQFYNPLRIPHQVRVPLEERPATTGVNRVGCRVVRKSELDAALKRFEKGYSPSYQDLLQALASDDLGAASAGGWRLEDFAELMLICKAGLTDDSPNYESLDILMRQKSMPMGAAVSFTFDDVR
jgi:hypothetical protein